MTLVELNNFGVGYETKEGKRYLYKSCNSEEMIAYIIKEDDEFKNIEKEKVFIIKLDDSAE